MQPVSERITSLTAGRYGELTLGPQLDATGIELGGSEREFASPLGRNARADRARVATGDRGGPWDAFVVLDDQLTQTDETRMGWTRRLLGQVAEESQVIVLTCHPLDYEAESPTHLVDLTIQLSRTDHA